MDLKQTHSRLAVHVAQPVSQAFYTWVGYRIYCILIAIDILFNALTGGDVYQTFSSRVGQSTFSSRVGQSIETGGWASKIPLPEWVKQHCLSSTYQVWV